MSSHFFLKYLMDKVDAGKGSRDRILKIEVNDPLLIEEKRFVL